MDISENRVVLENTYKQTDTYIHKHTHTDSTLF